MKISERYLSSNLIFFLGSTLLILLTCIYFLESFRNITARYFEAQRDSKELVVNYGDVPDRDVPKALAIKAGRFFEDAHYNNEVHWYPFSTPLLAAVISQYFFPQQNIHFSFFVADALCISLLFFTTGLLLFIILGDIGFIVLPIGIILNIFRVSVGYPYPERFALFLTTFYFAVAGILWNTILQTNSGSSLKFEDRSSKKVLLLFFALGLCNGLLITKASYLITATFISLNIFLLLIITQLKATNRNPLLILISTFLYIFPMVFILGLLFIPQFTHYGYLKQSDAARYVLDPVFKEGKSLEDFWHLAALPGGINGLFLYFFIYTFFIHNTDSTISSFSETKNKQTPILLGFVFSTIMTQLGFVINSQDPFLAPLAKKTMLAPPHTFGVSSIFINENIISLVVLGYAIRLLVDKLLELQKTFTTLKIKNYKSFLFSILMIVLYSLVIIQIPEKQPGYNLYSNVIEKKELQFAQSVSQIVGKDQTVYNAGSLWKLAYIKILFFDSDAHTNPYVQSERRTAYQKLQDMYLSPVERENLLKKYNINFAILEPNTVDPVTLLCEGETIMENYKGDKLIKLNGNCHGP